MLYLYIIVTINIFYFAWIRIVGSCEQASDRVLYRSIDFTDLSIFIYLSMVLIDGNSNNINICNA